MARNPITRSVSVRHDHSNLRLAFTHWQQAIVFGFLWALFLAAHSFVSLYFLGWQDLMSIGRFALLVFTGAFAGGTVGWFCSILFAARRIPPKRFTVGFVVILVSTIGLIAGLFALQYRQYYAQWHSIEFTITWFFQFAFTTASAFYLFAVQGLRTLLPFGPAGLLLVAWLFVKLAPSTDD